MMTRKGGFAVVCILACLLVAFVTAVNAADSKKAADSKNAVKAANTKKGESKMVENKSGLKYVDIVEGTGRVPKKGDKVTVHYTGRFEDGRKFDSSVDRGTPFQFRLGMREVIPGWDEGVATMKEGGKRKLIVPGNLAYGKRGIVSGGQVIIPPNATLIFDVEFIRIEK